MAKLAGLLKEQVEESWEREDEDIEEPCPDCLQPTYGKLHVCVSYCEKCDEELPYEAPDGSVIFYGNKDCGNEGRGVEPLCDKCKNSNNLKEQVEEGLPENKKQSSSQESNNVELALFDMLNGLAQDPNDICNITGHEWERCKEIWAIYLKLAKKYKSIESRKSK